MVIEYNSSLYWTLTALVFSGLLIAGVISVLGMIRLNRSQRRRLAARYNVEITSGLRGTWRISKESWARYPGNKLKLYAVVALTQLGLWLGFALMICAVIALLVLALSRVTLAA